MTDALSQQPDPNPNRMGTVMRLALEEILGVAGVEAVLNHCKLPEHTPADPASEQGRSFPPISHLSAGLENIYGLRAGRGLAQRVGRACFKYGLREFGAELGLTSLGFRLQPSQVKLMNAVEAFASLFNTYTDQKVHLDRDEQHLYWNMERCPLCRERQAEDPCCHLAVGLLEEALFWASGGKHFKVQEQKCIACGDDACTVLIDRTPMG